jgi:hypothetical protein
MHLMLLVFSVTIFTLAGFNSTVAHSLHNLLICWKSTLKPCIFRIINTVSLKTHGPIIWLSSVEIHALGGTFIIIDKDSSAH